MSQIDCVTTEKAPCSNRPIFPGHHCRKLDLCKRAIGDRTETGELVDDYFSSQTQKAMSNLQAIVEAAGSDMTNVVSVDVFMTNIANFSKFNEIYTAFFPSHKPARAAVEVSSLPKGGQVEIKCIAVKK